MEVHKVDPVINKYSLKNTLSEWIGYHDVGQLAGVKLLKDLTGKRLEDESLPSIIEVEEERLIMDKR